MKLETLASGYGLIEGPRVDAEDRLYFSDVTYGGVYRRAPDGEIDTVVPKRRGVGGIALHADGGIVVSGRDICHVRDGESRILYSDPDVPGFNDLHTDAAGRVYFGSLRSNPFASDEPRVPVRLATDGSCVALYGDVGLTNGIGFSPDESYLYYCDTAAGHVIRHRVENGAVADRSVFVAIERGRPDGLAVDEEGGVWVACYAGGCVARYAENGVLDRYVDVPADAITSLCFGGADRRDLYVVTADNRELPDAGGTIFRARAPVAGLPTPPARV